MLSRARAAAFGSLDVLLILALIVVLGFMMVPSLTLRAASRRDAQRIEDMQRIELAIARFWAERGSLPPAHESAEHDGWDVSNDGDFIPALREGGYLPDMPADPRNDEQYQYRYRVYPKGAFGCSAEGPTYVLGVRSFESAGPQHAAPGGFSCPERDFSREFAWVHGGSVPSR
jgi:hypothetical protein